MHQKPAQSGGKADVETLRKQAIQTLMAGRMPEGILLLERALALSPLSGDIHADLATAYRQTGKPGEADQHYARAVGLVPENALILSAYALFLVEQGQTAKAEPLLTRAEALNPGHPDIKNNLGILYFKKSDFPKAAEAFAEVTRLRPQWPVGYANLGDALKSAGRPDAAEKSYQRALRLKPDNAYTWARLAEVYLDLKREDEAIDSLRRATELAPEARDLRIRFIQILELQGKLDEASDAIDKALKIFDAPGVLIMKAKLLRRRGDTAEAITLLEKYRAAFTGSPQGKGASAYFFELGQVYDRENRIDDAFDAFSQANAIQDRLEGTAKARQDCAGHIANCLRHYTPSLAKDSCAMPSSSGGTAPVFLIGFPRSGTTLLDQILSSHEKIFVADEVDGVDRAILEFVYAFGEGYQETVAAWAAQGAVGEPPWFLKNPCYPAALDRLQTPDIEALRRAFYKQHGIRVEETGGKIFVDKMPLNLVHAGFIKRVFPDAKFILALRHPCDSVLSCFMQEFEMNMYMQRFLDLKDAARFYDEVFGLWEHYRRIFGLNVHTIHYEDVVADFRPTVAGMLEFLGVEWTDAVLEYDKTALRKGRVTTPSYHQVTEKIYTRASGRWLRYRKHLEPVLPILEPWVLKHGYSMSETGTGS